MIQWHAGRSSRGQMKRILLACALATSLHAQRLDDQITVNVIEVPVYVTRGGEPVRGLTAEDFELYVNGVRHPIRYFDVVEDQPAQPETVTNESEPSPAPTPLDRRRMTVLLFDTRSTTYQRLQLAKKSALKFVSEAAEGDTLAVARLSRGGTKFVVPFTADHVAVQRAISTLTPSRAGDVFSLATLDSERLRFANVSSSELPDQANPFANAANPFPRSAGAALAGAALAFEARVNERKRRDDQNLVANDLADLADRLSVINGVKHVVLLAEGEPGGADLMAASRMHAHFHAAGVILDAVELDGMYVPELSSSSGRGSQVAAGMAALLSRHDDKVASLYTLALPTGGEVTKHGDPAAGLRHLRKMQSVTYVLGFNPPAKQKKNNGISVRVRGQRFGTTVNYRRGYSAESNGDHGDGLFLADVMMNDIAQRGLTLDLGVQRDVGHATIVASVPGRELVAYAGETNQVLVDAFLYVFDENDLVAGWSYWQLRIDLDKGREFLEANPYAIRQEYDLPSGHYSAKALFRFVGSDVTGFQRTDFEIVR